MNMRARTGLRSILAAAAAGIVAFASPTANAQTTIACGCSTETGALAACLGEFGRLPADPLIGDRVVNDIFHTSDGHDARSLTFGTYVRGYAEPLPFAPGAGCIGSSNGIAPLYATTTCASCNCPTCSPTVCTNYVCSTPSDFATAIRDAANTLDWRWWQLYRQSWESGWTSSAPDVGTSPPGARDCDDLNDIAHCSYNPSHGLIYDLGGEANRAAIFPITDHTTDSCLEAIEWSVWLTDNVDATEVVRDGEPPDPSRWNRARLDQIFLQGWTRNPQAMGDPSDTHDLRDLSNGDAQSDSPTVVFSLPCGVTFRYASVMSGNFGNPGPACEYNSAEDEIDAVAGLNADNTGLCGDVDNDGHRDAACGGDDCNDHDATIHPGAVERCDDPDLNCDAMTGCTTPGLTCINHFCTSPCLEGACADGFVCQVVASDGGRVDGCVPAACAGAMCNAGQVCGPAGCQDPCDGAVCPPGEVCRGGDCVDPCAGAACPAQQHCEAGRCVPNCSCFTCATHPGLVCEAAGVRCVSADCEPNVCPPGQIRDCTAATAVCRTPCEGVQCPVGQLCDTADGLCHRDRCFGVACASGFVCRDGACVPGAASDAGLSDAGVFDSGGGVDAGRMDASASDGRADGARGDGSTNAHNDGSCACSTPGARDSRASRLAWMVLFAIAALAAKRRAR
jgi:hypothetical protein